MKTRALVPLISLFAAGCHAAPPGPSDGDATAGAEAPQEAPQEAPATAVAFVEQLVALAARGDATAVEARVDHAFAERLPSDPPLADLVRGFEAGRCTLEEGPGYGAVAIPPPMDEPPDEAARIEAIIEELQASTEVIATCTETEVYQDEVDEPPTEHVSERPLFAVAVRRRGDGAFEALAWRRFEDDIPGNI